MPVPAPAAPRKLTAAEYLAIFEELKNWGRWGADDDRGTLNLIGEAERAAALRLASGETTVSLAHTLSSVPGATNMFPIVHGVLPDKHSRLADGTEIGHHLEWIGMRIHGQGITHLDALCHFNVNGVSYNGIRYGDTPLPSKATISTMREGIVARGVLLDAPRALGIEWIEPGHSVSAEIAEHCESEQAVKVRTGDVVLVRTGRVARQKKLGPWKTMQEIAGTDATLLRWLRERDAAMLGCDSASETYPPPTEGLRTPVHVLALVAMGMPLIDNAALEPIAEACATRDRWEFLIVIAPLDYPGGSSSPVDPVAIF